MARLTFQNGLPAFAVFDATIGQLHGARQIALATATTQAAAHTADVTFYQGVATAAKAAGLTDAFVEANVALKTLNATPVT
jgi:hypothetical protein